MSTQEILDSVGQFSASEVLLFKKHTVQKSFDKSTVLLQAGEICRSVYFILSGSFFQFNSTGETENIIDLHLPKEWMFNHPSLINQIPSDTTIKAFEQSEVLELSLNNLHSLIAQSQSFLALARIFDQTNHRTFLFDNALNPDQKYSYIKSVKPHIVQVFPVKMIASYLKMSAETLSRVRAKQ